MQAWLSRCWDHTLGAPGHRPGATRWLSAWGRVGVGPPHQLPSWGPLAALKDLTSTTARELRLEPRGRRPGGAFPAPAPGVLGAGGRGSPGPGPLWGRDELTPPPGAAGPSVCSQHSPPPTAPRGPLRSPYLRQRPGWQRLPHCGHLDPCQHQPWPCKGGLASCPGAPGQEAPGWPQPACPVPVPASRGPLTPWGRPAPASTGFLLALLVLVYIFTTVSIFIGYFIKVFLYRAHLFYIASPDRAGV